MATLLAALAGCFWWFVDVVICFMVSSSVLALAGIVVALLYKRLEPAKDEDSIKDMGRKLTKLSTTNRIVLLSSPLVVFVSALIWRVWDIVVNDSTRTKLQCEEVGDEMLSGIMPTWFAPFWIVDDYKMDMAVVPLRLTKMLFISSFLLAFPLMVAAFHYVSKHERPIFKLALGLVNSYQKWSNLPCGNHLQRIIQLEWAEEQYLQTIVKATVAIMEKEAEVTKLEMKIKKLEESVIEVNRWVNSERRLANSFDEKSKEIEKKLSSERRRVQGLESRCLDLERQLESGTRSNALLERRVHEQQKKMSTLEQRPVTKVVKQQINSEDILCVICMERKRQYLLRPCNHYCVCNKCKSTLQNKCPLCRKLIQNYEKIYIS